MNTTIDPGTAPFQQRVFRPSAQKEHVLQLALQTFGTVPGVVKELAERSPAVAASYVNGIKTMESAFFSPLEMNVIELKISLLNQCEPCVKGHTFLSKNAGLRDEDLQQILKGGATQVARLNVLMKSAEYIYFSGSGVFPDIVLDYFEDEGVTEQEVIDIIGLIALKTISNYTNNYLKSVRQKRTVL